MTTTIRIWSQAAAIDGWLWTGQDQPLVDMLNAMLDPLGPSGADPAPDYHAALAAIEQFGGEVLSFELPEYVEGGIY